MITFLITSTLYIMKLLYAIANINIQQYSEQIKTPYSVDFVPATVVNTINYLRPLVFVIAIFLDFILVYKIIEFMKGLI